MAVERQLDLLAGHTASSAVEHLATRLRAWAERGVYIGGSSWKYEGWLGQLYTRDRYLVRGKFSNARFQQRCLEEYAQVFPTVCGDFSFYQFYPDKFWQSLFAQVPADFQFGFKVPEQITCPYFPNHPRYGQRAGQPNADFLNAELVQREFLDRLRPYRPQVGYLLFEFPQFHRATPASNRLFLARLDQFLDALPEDFSMGVEVRTKSLLGGDYFACLRRHGISHVFNSWTRMPTIGEQLALPGAFPQDTVIGRALLKPGRSYEQAVAEFRPYREVRDPWPQGYRDAAQLIRAAKKKNPKGKTYLSVNNRFVGNSIGAIQEILNELDSSPA